MNGKETNALKTTQDALDTAIRVGEKLQARVSLALEEIGNTRSPLLIRVVAALKGEEYDK